jgi:hypothetical protein
MGITTSGNFRTANQQGLPMSNCFASLTMAQVEEVKAADQTYQTRMASGDPETTSLVIGHWIGYFEIDLPSSIAQSKRWQDLMPFAAGTGRELETERLAMIFDWVWDVVMPIFQPVANRVGFGPQWQEAITLRSEPMSKDFTKLSGEDRHDAWTALQFAVAAEKLFKVPNWAVGPEERPSVRDATAVHCAEMAIDVAALAVYRLVGAVVNSAADVAFANWYSVGVSDKDADVAASQAGDIAREGAWAQINPCGLIEGLISCHARQDSHKAAQFS